ncbi:MAG: hypothetical protein FWE37_04580 [Spirochaetaceae bacterium]|nr:hypothetical protein [Spirochaetaceae bacterium]
MIERDILIALFTALMVTGTAIIVLICTLRSNKKMQKANNNFQSSLIAERNITEKINREKQVITEAYNSLQEFLFIGERIKARNKEDFQSCVEQINKLYVLFRQSINNMRFNTNIYQDRKKCIGCTLGDIKMQGDLARAMKNLREIIIEIDKEISYAFSFLYLTLDDTSDTIELNRQQGNMGKIVKNYRRINELSKDDNEIQENIKEIDKLIPLIENTKEQVENKIKIIAENNTQARTKISDIISNNMPPLNKAIYEYFDIYHEYTRQVTEYIKHKGSISSNCKKYCTNYDGSKTN